MSLPSESVAAVDKPVNLESLIGQLERANSRVFDVNEQLEDLANRIYGGITPEANKTGDSPGNNINDQLNHLHSQLATLETRVARIRGE